jgi:hypothetical protein
MTLRKVSFWVAVGAVSVAAPIIVKIVAQRTGLDGLARLVDYANAPASV